MALTRVNINLVAPASTAERRRLGTVALEDFTLNEEGLVLR